MDLKKPLSISDQILRFKDHHMTIDNESFACAYLQKVSYYRLTGYALQFRVSPENSDYIPGTKFSTVSSICDFDSELRHLLRKYIEIIEVYYRCLIANEFSLQKCIVPPYNQHYSFNNYYLSDSAEAIFQKFADNYCSYYSDTEIVKHHRECYNNFFPLWVIVEMIPFSDLSKLYQCMYISDAEVIASHTAFNHVMLKNHLKCFSILRNKCAHAARLYNADLKPPIMISSKFLRKHPDIQNSSLFAYILVMYKHISDPKFRSDYSEELKHLIHKYSGLIDLSLIGFVNDWENYFE